MYDVDMKLKSFFKLVNQKVKKFDKVATNPFASTPVSITLVWVEEAKIDENKYKTVYQNIN